jgi:hypothetical protein
MSLSNSQIVDQFIHQQLAQSGDAWNVISRMDDSVVMGRKKKVSHLWHLFLSIISAGLWVIIWIIMVIARKEERRIVEVADDGKTISMKQTGIFGSSQTWNIKPGEGDSVSFGRKIF